MNPVCKREARVSDVIIKLTNLIVIYPKTMSIKKEALGQSSAKELMPLFLCQVKLIWAIILFTCSYPRIGVQRIICSDPLRIATVMVLIVSALEQLYFHLTWVTVTGSCETSHKSLCWEGACLILPTRRFTASKREGSLRLLFTLNSLMVLFCVAPLTHCVITDLRFKNRIHWVILCNAIPDMKI